MSMISALVDYAERNDNLEIAPPAPTYDNNIGFDGPQ